MKNKVMLHARSGPGPGPASVPLLTPYELLNLYQSAESMLPAGSPKTFLLISATPREGTSTIASELAYAVADAMNRRVLLIHVEDNAKPPCSGDASGLEAVLRGDITIDAAISQQGLVPVYLARLLVAGPSSGHLFEPELVGDLFKHLLEVVEIVIVDAPPALTHFAGLALARHVGGVILVIEAERTRSSIVDQARRIIEMNGGRILGAVLNKRHLHIPRIIYQWL